MWWPLAHWCNVDLESAPYLVPIEAVQAMIPHCLTAARSVQLSALNRDVNAALDSHERARRALRERWGLE